MKKGFINEAFRLQQLAGIAPINEISDSNTLNTLGAYEDENGKTVVSDLIKNEKFIEDKLRKAGIPSSKEYDQDIHGQKIVIFTIEAEGMSRGMQRELDGDASRQMHEEASQGEVINLYHIKELQSLPDEVEEILEKGDISNEEYVTGVLGKTADFDSEEAEESGAYDYNEAPLYFFVEQGIMSDSNVLATIEIGATYIDNVFFYDQGNGYVAVQEDYTGFFGVTTKEAAEEAIQLMKTM
jgi:hypothetical protein